MKHNKTHKRNKNNKKLNSKSEKTKKRKTTNKTTGGKVPHVKVISKFIEKDSEDKTDVNRFDINIRSYYELNDYLYQVEDFLKRFELDLLNYTDKTEYDDVITKQKNRTETEERMFTIKKR
jgi:hypothetical protein